MPILADLRINGKTVATVEIRNDGTGDEDFGNYDVYLARGDTRSLSIGRTIRHQEARVEGFNRHRGAVALLKEALIALYEPVEVDGMLFDPETGNAIGEA